MEGDTIVGIATPPGEGGIAVIRISGEEAVSIFEKAFRPVGKRPPFESHRMMYGHVVRGEEVLDEAMGVVMLSPRTYTREDVCEIQTHGGHVAASLTVRLLTELGARPAEPGEFTRRAFLNGRIDLVQAEAVMGVITAASVSAMHAQQRQLQGGQSRFLQEARESLTALLAGLEAHIDYPDEIGEEEATEGLTQGLDRLIAKLDSAVDERGTRILREGLHVALCGCPNAGKSTLFNTLLGEDRAIVTAIPGTTRDVLEGTFTLNGTDVYLQDTAGLRDSDDPVEAIGVERARRALERADAVLILIDASDALTPGEEELLRRTYAAPCAVLLNKQDAGQVILPADIAPLAGGVPVFAVSASMGDGLDAVRTWLRSFLRDPDDLLLLQERHTLVAKQVLDHLRAAREGLDGMLPPDLCAVDLHEALYLLGRITGENVDEQLLDDIFSRFCVGK